MANAVLQGACLGEADMSGAQLDNAVITAPTSLKRTSAGLDSVMRCSTRLISAMQGLGTRSWLGPRCGADLRGAYLRLAQLDGADLSDANLEEVEGLTQGQLDRAHCNSGTKLPAGLTGVEDAKR